MNRRGDDKPRGPRPGPSRYEQFGSHDDGACWVTIADCDPRGGLRWVDGWERRATGWVPLNEFVQGDGRW